MHLEILANELLLDVFDYLHIADQFHAFYNLNYRFSKLIFLHLQTHGHFNLYSITKISFDIICQKYLSQFLNRIISIQLFDENKSVQHTTLFLSYGYQFHQFIYLKSLTLNHIHSAEHLRLIINELHHLNNFTRLQIKQCEIDDELINHGSIFDQIWNLSKLTHCRFERKKYLWNPFFISPKSLSTSINYLYLDGFSYDSNELHRLFENTINLVNLYITLDHNYDYQSISSPILSLKKLKISLQYSSHVTNHLLHYMPDLTHLTIELSYVFVDGDEWKEIITNYLPNLKDFHLKMDVSRRWNSKINGQPDRLLQSFRSQFWLVERQWFVQCHWFTLNLLVKISFYTLPYNFNQFLINSDLKFQSTCPNNDIHWSYDEVKNLTYYSSNRHSIRFNEVENLEIYLPIDDSFWFMVPNLHRLISLTVKSVRTIVGKIQLKNLLRCTTNLYSLTLKECPVSYRLLFSLKNLSIRRLDLSEFGCFNEEQCRQLTCSTLGIQCETLFITVETRIDILVLVNEMKHLRMLNVRCENYGQVRKINECNVEDELVTFLKNFLPRTCVITGGTSSNLTSIQIWIR